MNLFRYPIVFWGILWFVYFILHIQASVGWSLFRATLIIISQLGIFYLTKKLLNKNYFENRSLFILIIIITSIILSVLGTYIEFLTYLLITNPFDSPPPLFLITLMKFVLLLVASWVCISIFIFKQDRNRLKEIAVLKNEKTDVELKFLKAQINPHFLFNALNNIYTISYIGDPTAPEKIAMLSDMLRYVLYDCNSDFVPLKKEVKYLKNYIAFQQLKTETKQKIAFNIQLDNENSQIASMILIPLIENSFKHSLITKDKNGYVELKLTQHKKRLEFTVKNSIPEQKVESRNSQNGIGINNLRNRLKLIYNDNFNLSTENKGNEYFASLKIPV